jgi:predicted SnoaL-like aldol condensation-catalyzing enzyme
MSLEENKAIVRNLFDELFNKGNPAAANAVIAEDFIDHSPLPAPAPGAEGFAKRTVMLRAAFGIKAEFSVFLAEDDLVSFA